MKVRCMMDCGGGSARNGNGDEECLGIPDLIGNKAHFRFSHFPVHKSHFP